MRSNADIADHLAALVDELRVSSHVSDWVDDESEVLTVIEAAPLRT